MELIDTLRDTLFSAHAQRVLLLGLLAAPVGFAAVVALCGSQHRTARRLAGLCAAVHLAVTAGVVAYAAINLGSLSGYTQFTDMKYFRPVSVPGDTGGTAKIDGGGEEHATGWNLFFVAKPKPGYPPPAVQFFVGLDGLNVWLIALTSLMTYVAVAVSWNSAREKAGGYYAWVFLLQSAVTGAFLSFDLLLFYVFFELTLIPAFFLIGGWGVGGGKRDAARKFFLYTLLGSLFTLIGIIGLVYTNPTVTNVREWQKQPGLVVTPGPVTFDVNKLLLNVNNWQESHKANVTVWTAKVEDARQEVLAAKDRATAHQTSTLGAHEVALKEATERRDAYKASQFWLFFALIAGFVVKIPLVPFHTWLPAAYAEAPPAVTLLLTALLSKLGVLGLIRFVVPLCPDMSVQYGLPVFGLLGAIGVVYAAFCAFAQKDMKGMAAYSSVSHLGLLALGLFALNREGLSGAVLHMVNHGLTAGLMFALVAFLYDRYRTTDMARLGGLMARHPRFAFFTVVVCLASVGLPGLNNFVSEMLLISALFTPWNTATMGYGLAVAAAAGLFLSAWYTFTMLRAVFFGPLKEPPPADSAPTTDFTGREVLAVGLPTLLCLALGLFPQVILDTVKGDVSVVAARIDAARERLDPDLAAREQPPAVSGLRQPAPPPGAIPGPAALRPAGAPRPPGGGPQQRPPQ